MRTVSYEEGKVILIDQTSLPEKFQLIKTNDIRRLAEAIKKMEVRGAPAVGVTAAFGMALAAIHSKAKNTDELLNDLKKAKDLLASTRPTTLNLHWALRHMMSFAEKNIADQKIAEKMLAEAQRIADEDVSINKKLAEYGNELIFDGATIHTHCNCGPLCAVDLGTAMAPVIYAHQQGKRVHVITDETRPRFQGAKLNAWELANADVPYTLITDNHAAAMFAQGNTDMVMIGVDYVVANGDTAAKIGVFGLAILAKYFKVPFYAISPLSTIDLSIPSGDQIVIEKRDPDEVRMVNGTYVTMPDANVVNYAFDVTPHELITAFVTEKGIIYPPFDENFKKLN
jgi:methylthioribose-1-phosphate isomerase